MNVEPILLGNRCGHRVDQPRFYQPNKPSAIKILQNAQDNCKKFYYQYSKCHYLPSLLIVRNSNRKIRSEGREHILSIVQILIQYCDLASMKVGVPNQNGTFWSPSLKWLAEKAGFRKSTDPHLVGQKRAWRAIKTLVNAGYIEVQQRSKLNAEGQFKSFAAIKKVSEKLFLELGISKQRFDNYRKTAVKRFKRLQRQQAEKQSINKIKATIDIFNIKKEQQYSNQKIKRKQIVQKTQRHKHQAIEKERQLIQKALQLAETHKVSPTDILLKLRKQS